MINIIKIIFLFKDNVLTVMTTSMNGTQKKKLKILFFSSSFSFHIKGPAKPARPEFQPEGLPVAERSICCVILCIFKLYRSIFPCCLGVRTNERDMGTFPPKAVFPFWTLPDPGLVPKGTSQGRKRNVTSSNCVNAPIAWICRCSPRALSRTWLGQAKPSRAPRSPRAMLSPLPPLWRSTWATRTDFFEAWEAAKKNTDKFQGFLPVNLLGRSGENVFDKFFLGLFSKWLIPESGKSGYLIFEIRSVTM